jgi:uncharacterized protein (TIGR03000 family)
MHGGMHGGNFHHGGFNHGGVFIGGGWGFGYPWYSDYAYSPYSYGGTPYYDAIPYYSGGTPYYSYGDLARPAPASDNTARVRVVVPADAKVWFGSSATEQGGTVRDFQSPPLTPGKDYGYDVKAQWTENGKEVTRTRHVDVRANSATSVDFGKPE